MSKFQIYQDKAGYFRWRLLASNGQKVATSGEAFISRSYAELAARKVRIWSRNAKIEHLNYKSIRR